MPGRAVIWGGPRGRVGVPDLGLQGCVCWLLITAGLGTFEPRPLPAGSEYEGRGLRYFVPRLADLAGQDMVVVGGGDSAVDWALALRRRCIRRRRGGPLR
jgi:hypothetical protein